MKKLVLTLIILFCTTSIVVAQQSYNIEEAQKIAAENGTPLIGISDKESYYFDPEQKSYLPKKEFIEKYFMTVSKESNLMSGFVGIYNLLKEQGHEFVVITARGGFIKEMKDDAIRLLEENNIKFDKYYWNVEDKLEICKNEKVDIMIDDDWKIIKRLADNEVKTLYFRDTNLMKLEENEYIKEVNNWGEIYRYIRYN